jgi:hypothetical protein
VRPGVGRQAGRADRGGNHQRRDAGSQNPMHRGKPLRLRPAPGTHGEAKGSRVGPREIGPAASSGGFARYEACPRRRPPA